MRALCTAVVAAALIAFVPPSHTAAQIPSRTVRSLPDPTAIGNGPRALGMANAVTAVADDLGSIGFNPAGLSFLDRAEFGLVGRVLIMSTDAQGTTNNPTPTGFPRFSADGEFAGALDPLEFGGIAIPFNGGGRTVAIGIAYRRFADGIRLGTYKMRRRESNGRFFSTISYVNDGGLRALSPTIAVELTDRIRIGATANLLSGETRYVQKAPEALSGGQSARTIRTESFERDFAGLALEVGAMYQASERLRFGLHATLPHERTFTLVNGNTSTALTRAAPLQLNLGAMRRLNDRAFVSVDLRHAPWSGVDLTEDAGGTVVPTSVGVQDATGLHVGYERDVSNEQRASALRLGVFGRTTSLEDLDGKQIGAYGATIGQSWHWARWSFEGGVLVGRSTPWLRSTAPESNATLTNTDFIVSLGLKRRF